MNAIVPIEKQNPIAVYTGGLDAVLENLAQEARAIVPDISTEVGRKEIASNAYKVARSKTLLDDMGKKLGEEAKAKLDAINADRKKARDFCDALKDEVRKPLTEWEDKEKGRINGLEDGITYMEHLSIYGDSITEGELLSRIASLDRGYRSHEWAEFTVRAEDAYAKTHSNITRMLEDVRRREMEREELARLRAEAAERERQEAERQRIEREDRLKVEAADKARKDAEEQAAKAAQQAADRAAHELAQERAKEEKSRQEAKAAEERAKKAEDDRVAAIEQAERDRIIASERAEREKQAAVEAERQRAADQAKVEAEAAAKREADKNHRKKINNEILAALLETEIALSEDVGKIIVEALVKGIIPHVKVIY